MITHEASLSQRVETVNMCTDMPQHRCGMRIHVPTLYDFVTDT